MRKAMEPVGFGSAEMWNNPEDGGWIYTKTMRVASLMWQIWKRGVLGLLLLSSLPILLPVLLLAFGVGFIFLLPFLPGVAVYFVLSRRFPALRISGWYRYLTSYTPGFITSADTGVIEEEAPIVYEDDNIQHEESQETSDDGSQDIEEEIVSDTWSQPHIEGGECNVLQEVSELRRVPSSSPSPIEGIANEVQEGEEQSFSPKQHDIRSIEDEAGEGMDDEMVPEIQGLHPVEVLSSENGADESSLQEYAVADVSSEPSIPVADFQRPFGGHEGIQEEGKEDADLSLPVDDVGDELASSEGDQGDEGKVLPQEESSAKADLPPILTEESLAKAVPTSDILPPLEELSGSRDLEEELDAMHANREEEKEVVTGEDSPVEAVLGFDPPLSCEQLLPSRLQQKELDDKDVDEEGDKNVLTGEASPAEVAALDFDIRSLPEVSLSSRYDHPEELHGKDVDEEGEKALIGDTSPAETVSGSDLPSHLEQLMPSRPCQKELDGKDVEEEEKALTGEASPRETISGSDLSSTSQQLFPSRPCQEELDGKDVDEEEQEKALTAETPPAETVLGSELPSPSKLLLPSRPHQEELDGKDVDEEKQEKALTSEASPAEAVSGSDLHLSSEELLPSSQQLEKLDSKDEEEGKQEKALTGEESRVNAALDSDVLSPSEESLSSRDEHKEEPHGKDVGEGKEEKALIGEPSPAEEAASESGILSTFEGLLQLGPQQEELDAKDADGVEGEKDLTGVASSAEVVSGSDLSTPSEQLLPSRLQEAVGGVVADEEEEKVLSGEESLAEEVLRTDLPTEKLLHEEEIDGKDADKKEQRDITGEESVAEVTLDSDIPFPSEESLPPGQYQYVEELDGKDADEVDKRKVRSEEESPAEAVSPFDVVSEALPSKSEDSEAGQVTEEQKSNGEREPCAEESPIYESPSEYDSTQEEEEGESLEETVVTNLSANHSLAQGEFHKQTSGDVAEEEAAQDIFHEFESESEEDYFLSPGVSVSEEFLEEELVLTDPAHLQPPGGQDEQVPDMEAEHEEQEEGETFARPSSAAETTAAELGSAIHGQFEDNVLDKEEGVKELTVADSASEKPLPAEVHNIIDEAEDKMAYKQQPANEELPGPDSKPPEEDQQQLDINVATEKDELDNLKGNESKSANEDISSSDVPVEELTNNGDIGLASEHPLLSRNDDKELIRNEPSQEESQEDNVKAKDSAGYNFGTGEEKNKAVTDINGEGELAEKNVHVEEQKSTNDISLNLNAEYPTTFPVSEQKSDSGPTPEYPREFDKKYESGAFPEDAQKDTQPVVVTPEEEEFNTARFMEQQDDKSASPNPPDIVVDTREESTPEVTSDLSEFAKESHLQLGHVPELEIDDDESLNETQIPGGILLPEQEQRHNMKSTSESTSNMPEEPTSPSKITASRVRGFVEGQQPGPLSPQSAPNSTVTEGDSSQDAHSLSLEDKTLEESGAADQHEVRANERNQEAEKVPSSRGSNVAGDMEVLSVDKNEETNSSGEPTSLPQRRLSFSEAGDEVAVENLGVPFAEEHNKDCRPDHEELPINTSDYIWPPEAEVHGLYGIPLVVTESEGSVADNSTRTMRLEEPIPTQKPGTSNPVSEHPTLLSPDLLDLPEDWQSSCRKRREDELRPDGVSPTEPSLVSPASEANIATSTPPFGFSTHSPSQQQKSRTVGRRRSLLKHNRSMNRRSAPELVRSQTWAADSATSPPHDASREFKKTKYMDQTDIKEPMTRTSSAPQAQGVEEEEKEQATKFPDVSPNSTPSSGEAERQVREEISTIKRIIGQDTPLQDSLWEEVEILSQFVGIQLPNMADVSDLAKVRKGLELVKIVVGVR